MAALRRLLEAVPRYAMLLNSQYWKPDRLRSYTENRLRKTLEAASAIPF